MPMKGSQHDQINTWPIAQVRSVDFIRVWIVWIRIIEATQTLLSFSTYR